MLGMVYHSHDSMPCLRLGLVVLVVAVAVAVAAVVVAAVVVAAGAEKGEVWSSPMLAPIPFVS